MSDKKQYYEDGKTPVTSYDEYKKLEQQLAIATKALKGVKVWANTGNGGEQAVKKVCEQALKEIEEVKWQK